MVKRATRRRPRQVRPPSARSELALSVRHLLLLDATSLLTRIEARQDELVRLFSLLRDRAPLLAATHTTFSSVSFDALASLRPVEQRAAFAFFELVGELRWYLQYTEDMPGQLRASLGSFVARLREGHRALQLALGPSASFKRLAPCGRTPASTRPPPSRW